MSVEAINYQDMQALLYGSLILGAGGGGSLKSGQETIEKAFSIGQPTIIKIDDLMSNPEANVVTTSAVGAPAAKEQFVTGEDYNRVVTLMQEKMTEPIDAFVTNELGAGSTFNAFIQSASTGIPMIDAACNGRAHPLGTMGSMGLSENESYATIQTAVGGNPETNKYLELTAQGSVAITSSLVRQAADQAGGLVVVARNPVTASYVKDNAAIGALTMAIELGKSYLAGREGPDRVHQAADYLEGKVVVTGIISQLELTTAGGLDTGYLVVEEDGHQYKMHICNEYMALDIDNERQSTFPDLLMTFNSENGQPITSAELQEGQHISILHVSFDKLILGSGMYEASGYKAVEQLLEIDLLSFIDPIIR